MFYKNNNGEKKSFGELDAHQFSVGNARSIEKIKINMDQNEIETFLKNSCFNYF